MTSSSSMSASVHFNPRSSCEERHGAGNGLVDGWHFNPRSSCEERPFNMLEYLDTVKEFQSTLLMRGATRYRGGIRR